VSRPLDIPEAVRSAFRSAEVRLHRIPQLPRSCFIRVFLNLPDANAETSIEDAHYAGYLAIFGHGPATAGRAIARRRASPASTICARAITTLPQPPDQRHQAARRLLDAARRPSRSRWWSSAFDYCETTSCCGSRACR